MSRPDWFDKTVEVFLFDGDFEDLESKYDDKISYGGSYWESVSRFVDENRAKACGDLSFRQRDWLCKIKENLRESA